MMMKREWMATLREMRAAGWAVIWFDPCEVGYADVDRFVERLAEYGVDMLEEMQPDPEPEDDCPEHLEHTNRGL